MEASGGVIIRPNYTSIGGAGIDAHSHTHNYTLSSSSSFKKPSLSFSSSLIRGRSEHFNGGGFYDKGQLEYYYNFTNSPVPIKCVSGGGKKEKAKMKKKEKQESEKKMINKRLKLLKGLSRDLSVFSHMGFGFDSDQHHALGDQIKSKMLSEAAECLLQQLQQLKAEEKELKRKRKEEKARSKLKAAAAAHVQNRVLCNMSSSSSSESSGSECDEVVDLNRLKRDSIAWISSSKEAVVYPSIATVEGELSGSSSTLLMTTEDKEARSSSGLEEQLGLCCRDVTSVGPNDKMSIATGRKIEVCMGGKCKKSGAGSLLEEFQRLVGIDVAVSGCKCMGKCRDGPNVRVVNEGQDSVKTTANPLCIGVGLEDVGIILANLFGENQEQIGVTAIAP